MPIDVDCHQCKRAYRLKDEMNGKKFKCKECGAIVLAVPAGGSPPPASRPASQRASASKPSQKRRPVTEQPPDSPRRSQKPAAAKQKPAAAKRKPAADAAARPNKKAAPAPAAKRRKKKRPEPEPELYDDPFGGDIDDFGDDYGDDYGDSYGDDYDNSDNPYADDFENTPPRKKKKKGGKKKSSNGGGFSIGFNINRLNMLMVGGAIVLSVLGFNEARLSSNAGSEPTQISLAELVAGEAGSDVYFTVSGVESTSDEGEFVYEERSPGQYTRVWIPCRPAGTQGNRSRFILYSTDAGDDFAVGALLGAGTHTGMVTNAIRSLGKEERDLLNSIPGVNASDALIFEVGRTPSGAGTIALHFVGAAALGFGGLAWIFLVPSGSTSSSGTSVWSAGSSSGRSKSSGSQGPVSKARPPTFAQTFFSFQGRISRGRYWMANLLSLLVTIVLMVIIGVIGGNPPGGITMVLFFICGIAMAFTQIAIQVKRWHDRDKSGWFTLIGLIPYIGVLWVIVECGFLPGTSGNNRFGAEPR